MNNGAYIIAVDFDGTLCENKWPEIGEPYTEVIDYIKKRKSNGDKIILWTNRVEDKLEAAVRWCAEQGLIFDAVNDNLPEIVESFGGSNCRKIFANEYIDDRNRLVSTCREKSDMERWAENEVKIACKDERGDKPEEEWDYGCACYESAMKAYKSLCGDGHSGMSIGFTKAILNRLIDGKPLRPIEDTEENWNDISEYFKDGKKNVKFQCKRMGSLFKSVSSDGTIKYRDVNRYYGININDPNGAYHSGLIDTIMDELYPVTMPYMPEDKPFRVYTEDFLMDSTKNGDFDTIGVLYVITPDGKRVEISRYFKETETGFSEINSEEYVARKGYADTNKQG
jgi:hypothetical protein